MTVELPRPALEGFVFRIRGVALATLNATSTRPVLEDHASLCLPQTLLAVATGAMSIPNAQFTKNAPTTTVCDAKLVNV